MPKNIPTYRPPNPPGRAPRVNRKPLADHDRIGRTKFTSSKRWRKARSAYLRLHPLCLDCLAKGLRVEAKDVHHKRKRSDDPDGWFDFDNLMGLCKSCHSIRTKRGE